MTDKRRAYLKKRRRARAIRIIAAACLLAIILFYPGGKMVDETALVGASADQGVLAPVVETTEAPEPTPAPTPAPTSTPEPVSITLSFGGDCTLAGDVNSGSTRFQDVADSKGYDYFFENLKSIFEADDLTIVNLEGPLTDAKTKRENRQFNFRGDPANTAILTSGSVEVVNLANNHARDFLTEGYEDTMAAVEEAGIAGYGYSQTQVMDVRGVRVGFVGLTEWDYTTGEVAERVAGLRGECDVLIVSFHWGEERRYAATSTQRKYAQAAIDAGADLVVGHHSHVVGGIGAYNGVNTAFSLGNLCFGGNSNPDDKDSMIYQHTFTVDWQGNIVGASYNVIPITVSSVSNTNDYKPTVATGDAAKRIIDKIAKYSTEEITYTPAE